MPPRTIANPITQPFKRIFNRILDRELDKRTRAVLRLVPMGEFAEEDVFIAGYPKSGNTWFQNLVAGVVFGVNPELAPDTLIQELVPDVHQKKYFKRFQTPMFFKTHFLPQPKYKRVVYLVRDGRDVMVSFLHHNRALYGNEVDLMEMITQGKYLFECKWHEHVEQWKCNPYGAKMIVIRYEDLKNTPLNEMKKICGFIEIKRTDDFLASIIDQSSFTAMRKKEDAMGWDNPIWPKDKPFVRRGEVGSYKEEMPLAALQAFLHEATDALRQYGYE